MYVRIVDGFYWSILYTICSLFRIFVIDRNKKYINNTKPRNASMHIINTNTGSPKRYYSYWVNSETMLLLFSFDFFVA